MRGVGAATHAVARARLPTGRRRFAAADGVRIRGSGRDRRASPDAVDEVTAYARSFAGTGATGPVHAEAARAIGVHGTGHDGRADEARSVHARKSALALGVAATRLETRS